MRGQLAADQRHQIPHAFLCVVVQNMGAGDAARLFAFGIGQRPHPRIGELHVIPRQAGRRHDLVRLGDQVVHFVVIGFHPIQVAGIFQVGGADEVLPTPGHDEKMGDHPTLLLHTERCWEHRESDRR